MKPLEGMLVLDFSQFLSGPYAGLRLAELGAHVLKIENPKGGDLYRLLSISDLRLDGDQPLFHAANHGKESLAMDLKDRYTIIIVTHNMQQAARISDKTAFFLLGEMVEFDKTETLFSVPKDKRTEDYITGRFG